MVYQYAVDGFIGEELLLVNFIEKRIELTLSVTLIPSKVRPKPEIRSCKSNPRRIPFEPFICFATCLFIVTTLFAPTLSVKRNEYSPS